MLSKIPIFKGLTTSLNLITQPWKGGTPILKNTANGIKWYNILGLHSKPIKIKIAGGVCDTKYFNLPNVILSVYPCLIKGKNIRVLTSIQIH